MPVLWVNRFSYQGCCADIWTYACPPAMRGTDIGLVVTEMEVVNVTDLSKHSFIHLHMHKWLEATIYYFFSLFIHSTTTSPNHSLVDLLIHPSINSFVHRLDRHHVNSGPTPFIFANKWVTFFPTKLKTTILQALVAVADAYTLILMLYATHPPFQDPVPHNVPGGGWDTNLCGMSGTFHPLQRLWPLSLIAIRFVSQWVTRTILV